MTQLRKTANKIWISLLLRGEFHKEEGEFGSNYVLIGDKKISRVNVIAIVVDKFINEVHDAGTVEIDDGSGNILIKVWQDDVKIIDNVTIGDLILAVGKLRQFNDEIYIVPELIKTLKDMNWAKIRKLELEKEYGKGNPRVYATMNSIGAMHGNKETAKGRAMEKKHQVDSLRKKIK